MDASTTPKLISKKPKYSRFTQQEFPSWKPILTPKWVITTFVTIGILFTPAGLLCLWASERVVQIVDRYDDDCLPESYINNVDSFIQSNNTNKTCVRTIKVPRKMNAPIFIYYQLDNFYQNHRRYVKSRSDKQLRDPDEADETDDCKPKDRLNGNRDEPIVPCGLVAWSLFNDTYKFSKGNKVIEIDKKDIAWKSDKKIRFGSDVYPKNFQKGELIGGGELDESKPLSEQEDLIVWMRTAALPTFRKLYGKITTDLEADETITVVIQNNYNTYGFGGEKKLVLSTASWIGGKNDFFGISFLTTGAICFFVAICFILLYVLKPRPLGDPTYLSWNINQATQ
uniref:ALA-interacting subunit 5-like n=1 Tax=Erigeron canadensis TaxID=72917 RepID=UPI001CB910D9|nr:ALA-interacting subunit 5-like [Erigeron canadensis]